jgi:hypothetical protein
MGGINGDGCYSGFKHRWYFSFGGFNILFAFQTVVIGVDRHRNGDAQFIARCVDDPSDVPIIYGAIGIGTPLRLSNFNDNRSIGSLGGFKAPLMTKLFLPLAAMVMAPPLPSMALSINFPLTIKAWEFGKHLTTFGGRPICKAFSKSAAVPLFVSAMTLPP